MTAILRGRSIKDGVTRPLCGSARRTSRSSISAGQSIGSPCKKGTHRLIVGRLTGGCCGSLLRARIKHGFVVGIEAERCKESAPVDKRIAGVLQRAVRTLARRARRVLNRSRSGNF